MTSSMKVPSTVAACMLLLSGVIAARADFITGYLYTLDGVTFADGGTASGSFIAGIRRRWWG